MLRGYRMPLVISAQQVNDNLPGLRSGPEASYRALARLAPDTSTKIALADRASAIRPRTWS